MKLVLLFGAFLFSTAPVEAQSKSKYLIFCDSSVEASMACVVSYYFGSLNSVCNLAENDLFDKRYINDLVEAIRNAEGANVEAVDAAIQTTRSLHPDCL